MQHGGFKSRNLLDDAITIAVMETSVPVWALDAAALDGDLRLRTAAAGEGIPGGRLVVADAARPVAVLFGDIAAGAGVTQRTREIVLFSVAVPGVPPSTRPGSALDRVGHRRRRLEWAACPG